MDIFNSSIHIENKALFDYAASAARLMIPIGIKSSKQVQHRLGETMSTIKRCHSIVEKRSSDSSPAACQWLLDNMYMAKREYAAAAADFSAEKKLRCCKEGILILCLAESLVKASHGKVDEERCRLFLDGFQSVTVLRRAELELFPSALKAALLDALANASERLIANSDSSQLEKNFEAVFTSLRLLSVMDTEKLISSADISSAILSADPTGEYPLMDSETKRMYLKALSKKAKSMGLEEHKLASQLIEESKSKNIHVGFLLFEPDSEKRELLYITANLGLTLVFSLYIALFFDSAAPALLLLLPLSELVKNLIDFALLHIISPKPLPRMDVDKEIPPEGKSICVISALLTDENSAKELAVRLERFYKASGESKHLSFGILADLKPAECLKLSEDKEIVNSALCAVRALEKKYKTAFYLFTRERSFDGDSFSGHERKRGALTELAKLLIGEESALKVHGDADMLYGTEYIISLDSDTEIYPGSLQQLIGAMLHPLNRVQAEDGRVVRGHGIIHPKISNSLSSCHSSDFAIIYSGSGGSDPYGSLCSELYMDAFSSGGFAGKGIIHAASYLECSKQLPEGRILSHDALEGAYLRGAFMGSTEFCDAFPSNPLDYYKRQHRWVRGDWQNSPWIFKKELRPIERWRLFDSLRRSMVAPGTLLALLMGFYFLGKAVHAAAWAALLALLSNLVLSFAEESTKKRNQKSIPLRRYTRVLTGLGAAITQSFIRLWLLPFEAWVNLSAACTALWRMLVSGKKLLQWQTAAQYKGGGFADHIKAMLPAELLGFILLVSAPGIMGRATGLMWLLSPAAASALALPAKSPQELSSAHREYLRESLKGSWQYLWDFSSQEDNFLPPDNYQNHPAAAIAHRSSPTNMGFALASAVAAADMGICEKADAIIYMERLIGSLEKLPRCVGHFYNWYDTCTLTPLEPAFVSTVDSGNMYAGLLVAKNALSQWDESSLAARVEAIMAEMDFAPLYDKSRKLFYICYDSRTNKGAGGWYDLLASEAMLTSYIAISKGDVPVKHWRQLSRAQLQQDGYRGLASWTGTMFEYLMPELFLPFYRGSLLWESARFCVRAQKKHAFPGKPWGISESAFYSLDSSLSYRYKAHGVPALALKRGQEKDMVISPYSSYLSLSVEPLAAVKNLRRLESFGAKGQYGFIEALDFTAQRCRSNNGEKVSCYMAHHVGMSLLSGANAMCSGSIQRRFMAEPSMAAHKLLLQEQLPASPAVIRRDSTPTPQRPSRGSEQGWQLRSQDETQALTLLSNGIYHLITDSFASSRAMLNDTCIYLPESLKFKIFTDSKSHTLQPDKQPLLWEIAEDELRVKSRIADINCQSSISVAAGDFGELRTFTFSSRSEQNVRLSLSFVPILAKFSDYVNHPAFWNLGIHAQRQGNSVLFRRLKRGNQKELWLCVAFDKAVDTSPLGYVGGNSFEMHLQLKLSSGAKKHLRFALAAADTKQAALDSAQRILRDCDKGCMVSAAASRLQMSSSDIGSAMALLPHLLSNCLKEAVSVKELWRHGISGDYPIISCDINAREALGILKQFCLLSSCGVKAELVYLSSQLGEYNMPAHKSINEFLSKMGLEALLGSSIHIVPENCKASIESRAAFCVGKVPLKHKELFVPPLSQPRRRSALPQHHWQNGSLNYYVNLSLPSRSWQHVLSNGSFGAIVRDCGMAAMWYENAREMPLIKAVSNINSVGNPESIWAQSKGRSISLFAANDGYGCTVSFSPGCAHWEKQILGRQVKSSVFIPMDVNARVLIIRGAEGIHLNWALSPQMAADTKALSSYFENGIFSCKNADSFYEDLEFKALCSSFAHCDTDFCPAAMLMSLECEDVTVLVCGCDDSDKLKALCNVDRAMEAMEHCQKHWGNILGRFELSSGIDSLDHYANTWAVYQSIACRLWGRSSLYQSGGAFGFRDQLQDSVNIMLIEPSFARERILDCCRHQYQQGDVMHWWHVHPDGDKGLRSRCSDDLLWLVWALCSYCRATGDYEICAADINYVNSPILSDQEKDRYEVPETGKSASVLEHAKAALDCSINRGFGTHGLPFFGSGDWNDGLDNVDGESVWLGWFLSLCADSFADLLCKLCKPEFEYYHGIAEKVGKAANKSWNGNFYRRGYLADGSTLGGEQRIDSLPQSFAAMSPYADKEKVQSALRCALKLLVDSDTGIVKLFDPPFSPDEPYYGYISGYGEGFRENGGQYTHAAIWLAMACFMQGMQEEGFEIMLMLLPENHDISVYEAEPFVLAADVYSHQAQKGKAGWTWYTGSAAWYFRVLTEYMLGIKLENGKLSANPALPSAIPECSISIRSENFGEQHYKFTN